MSGTYRCGECGGGFPVPVKWQANWVCPWCYAEFMKHHANPAYSFENSREEFRRYRDAGNDQEERPMTDGGQPADAEQPMAPDPDDYRIPTIDELDAMRVAAGLSMKDLSDCAGFKSNRVSHILNNDVNPQTRTIRAFLTTLQAFDGHSPSGEQGPDPEPSELVDDDSDGPTEVDVDRIAARLRRLGHDAVGEDPTPPDADENLLTDGGRCSTGSGHPGWVCDGCGKHVAGAIPRDQCVDCGGRWFVATEDQLACDRCGHEDASSVLNSDHNRLCDDCVDYENRENPKCPECGRRMLPDWEDQWECPECWNHSLAPGPDRSKGGAE